MQIPHKQSARWLPLCLIDRHALPNRNPLPHQSNHKHRPALIGKGRSLLLILTGLIRSQELRLVTNPLPPLGQQRTDLGL